MNSVLCLSAEGLHKAVKHASDCACSRIAESSKEHTIDSKTYSIGNMICKQAAIDLGITAFEFFTVSKELLLTVYSFIATYVVILLQTPSAPTQTDKA
uniref:Uncharacterized protein n=1 Tax=Plectus sambesii TaxID=2011161 RepID=A0A914VGB1_9BILA